MYRSSTPVATIGQRLGLDPSELSTNPAMQRLCGVRDLGDPSTAIEN